MRLRALIEAVQAQADRLWESDPLNRTGNRVVARELYAALNAAGVPEQWGTRIGDGSIVILTEAVVRCTTITDQSLRVRTGGGPWRCPVPRELEQWVCRRWVTDGSAEGG